MPQLIALALLGAGVAAGYRWVARQMENARAAFDHKQEAERRSADDGQPKDLGELEWDAAAQVYRPRPRTS